jgi:hypothetical protein
MIYTLSVYDTELIQPILLLQTPIKADSSSEAYHIGQEIAFDKKKKAKRMLTVRKNKEGIFP